MIGYPLRLSTSKLEYSLITNESTEVQNAPVSQAPLVSALMVTTSYQLLTVNMVMVVD